MSLVNVETREIEVAKLNYYQSSTERGYNVEEREAHNIAMGEVHPHMIPKFENKYEERKWALEHMAAAFRYFAREGYCEGTAGHISVRDPVDPNTFWINPLGKHFKLMKAIDMVHVDEDGNILSDGPKCAINAAGFAIHSALHKARPDVNAACHTHSVYGKAYSAFGKPLEMLNQDVCTFYKSHSVYKNFGGVAIEASEGKEIAEAVGNGKGAILQNHGLITVGFTVDEAAYLFGLMERSCKVQLLVDSSSVPYTVIGEAEASFTEHITGDPESLYTDFQPDYEVELEEAKTSFLFN